MITTSTLELLFTGTECGQNETRFWLEIVDELRGSGSSAYFDKQSLHTPSERTAALCLGAFRILNFMGLPLWEFSWCQTEPDDQGPPNDSEKRGILGNCHACLSNAET